MSNRASRKRAASPRTSTTRRRKGLRILVADDDVAFLEQLVEAIWDAHHEEMCDYAERYFTGPPDSLPDADLDGEPEFDDDIPF